MPSERKALRVERGGAPTPVLPPDRGRLIQAGEIIRRYFADFDEVPDEEWVRATVPHKIKLSHRKVCWYERDVEQWLESLREDSAA